MASMTWASVGWESGKGAKHVRADRGPCRNTAKVEACFESPQMCQAILKFTNTNGKQESVLILGGRASGRIEPYRTIQPRTVPRQVTGEMHAVASQTDNC